MNSDTVNQVSYEFESALSDILPDLYQLLQHYQVSSPLEIVLNNLDPELGILCCVRCNGLRYCGNPPLLPPWCPPASCLNLTDIDDIPGSEPEETQQFSTDLASILSTVLPRLSESIQQMDERFEVRFCIDPAIANSSHVSCRFVDGILLCSDQPQGVLAA